MALINCPECKNQVSDQARSCPQCGHPLKKVEFTTHVVTHWGSIEIGGQEKLDKLLAEGWQIIDEDDSETWYDAEYKCSCRAYKYKLQR